MIGVFIQARLDSNRLPRKVILPVGGKSLICQAMDRLHHICADVYALLTDVDSWEELTPHAHASGFKCLAGAKDNVLARYTSAIRYYEVDTVLRATGDNPLVSCEMAQWILDEHLSVGADYSAPFGLPVGMGCEVIRADVLIEAEKEAVERYDKEHVTPFIYTRPDRFYLHRPLVPAKYRGKGRVTVDTREDLENIEKYF